jgi:hypothetical protein
MVEEAKDSSGYSITKTYSLKVKNVKIIDEISQKEGINKSEVINKIIEEYGK